MTEDLENFGTFQTGLVGAGVTTNHLLNEGHYSLSTLSTVPYVSLLGGSKTEKIFSWGEVVYVPKGRAVKIKNASYHDGDIVINGGRDFSTLPQRVTVPVPLTFEDVEGSDPPQTVVRPAYPVDSRRARRAFIALNLATGPTIASSIFFPFGRIEPSKGGHSHNALHQTFTGFPFPSGGVGYDTIPPVFLTPLTLYGVLPLGFKAGVVAPTIPHALLDTASFALVTLTEFVAQLQNAYYILEY